MEIENVSGVKKREAPPCISPPKTAPKEALHLCILRVSCQHRAQEVPSLMGRYPGCDPRLRPEPGLRTAPHALMPRRHAEDLVEILGMASG